LPRKYRTGDLTTLPWGNQQFCGAQQTKLAFSQRSKIHGQSISLAGSSAADKNQSGIASTAGTGS
jgi:hypothetical protein